MVRGSQNRQSDHNQGRTQTPVVMKPSRLDNDVPTSTTSSSNTQTANYTKLIQEEQKAITDMQEKIHTLEAKVYEPEGLINVIQTVTSQLPNMANAQWQYFRRPCLVI